MSKFSKAFGEKFEKNKLAILTRTFELGGHVFKVRIPHTIELEKIYNYFNNPDETAIEKEYQEAVKGIKNLDSEDIVKVDNDIIVAGRSMREAATNKVILQYRITEYFKFLIPEDGQSLEDLEYSDIALEFPLAIQIQFIDKINEVISPEYKDARGKS